MKVVFSFFSMLFVCSAVTAQYERYSLYQFSEPRVNPAYLATDNHATLSFLYRNQRSLPGVEINSSYVSANYPFLRKKSAWSGIGIELFNSEEGVEGIFSTTAFGAGYALNVPLNKFQSLSSGISMNYFQRSINTAALLTGNQYVDNFGFDPILDPGENLDLFRVQYLSANWGIRWQRVDKRKNPKDHLGIAIYNLNTPAEDFIVDQNTQLPMIFTLEGSKRMYESRQWMFDLEVFVQKDNSRPLWMTGGTSTLDLSYLDRRMRGQSAGLSLRYVHYQGVQFALEWDNELFAVGTSYELPFGENAAQNGAFEIGIKLKKEVRAKPKRRRGRGRIRRLPPGIRRSNPEDDELTIIGNPDSLDTSDDVDTLVEMPAQDVDTSKVYIIHIEFDFNSSIPKPGAEIEAFLEQVASTLRQDPTLAITIIGHTDDVGSRGYNQRLSEDRANAVYNLLIMKGVSFDQMSYQGKGEQIPIYNNSTEVGRTGNRRVEISFYSKY